MRPRLGQRGSAVVVLIDTMALIVVIIVWFTFTPIVDQFRGQTGEGIDPEHEDRADIDQALSMWDWFMMLWPIPVIIGIVIHMFVNVSTPSYETGRRWG